MLSADRRSDPTIHDIRFQRNDRHRPIKFASQNQGVKPVVMVWHRLSSIRQHQSAPATAMGFPAPNAIYFRPSVGSCSVRARALRWNCCVFRRVHRTARAVTLQSRWHCPRVREHRASRNETGWTPFGWSDCKSSIGPTVTTPAFGKFYVNSRSRTVAGIL